MNPAGLAVGGLIAVVALILYEQSKNATASGTSTSPAPASGSQSPAPALTPAQQAGGNVLAATPAPATTMAQVAATLPQFSSAANPSIIDTSATPTWTGSTYTCPNGDIPYYDPSTGAVYCVLPGLVPASANTDNDIILDTLMGQS